MALMNKDIYDLMTGAMPFLFLIVFVFSIPTYRNPDVPDYMKGFFWYSLIGVLLGAFLFLSRIAHSQQIFTLFSVLNKLSLIYVYIFLSLFILKILEMNIVKKIVRVLFISLLFLVMAAVLYDIKHRTFFRSFTLVNFTLFIFCILYYYQLFQKTPNTFLFQDASFWIVTAIFLGMGLSIPMAVFKDYLIEHSNPSQARAIAVIGLAPYVIMQSLFLKGYLCSIKTSRR